MGLGTGSSLGGSPTADRPLTPRTAPAALAAGSLRAAADVGRAAAARRSALPRTGCRGADRRRGAADLTQVHRTRVALGQLLALRGCISRSISVAARCLSLRSLRLALTALPDFFVVWSSWGDLSAMDLLPRRRREERLVSSSPAPEVSYADGRFDDDVETALASLPEDFRAAVVLCDVEGLSYEEIADVLGVKLGTVRSRIHRGRAMLRTALQHRAPTVGRTRFAGPVEPSAVGL